MVDFNGEPKFLIDASVFGGSSGSPVFIIDFGGKPDRNSNVLIGNPVVIFVGVVAETYQRVADEIELNAANERKLATFENLDLGVVIKTRTVVETFEAWISSLSD